MLLWNAWNDVMAAILNVWRQIENRLRQSMHIYMTAKFHFHPDPIWNDGVLDFFEEVAPTRRRISTRWMAIWDQCDMRSVPDLKVTHLCRLLAGRAIGGVSSRRLSRFRVTCEVHMSAIWRNVGYTIRMDRFYQRRNSLKLPLICKLAKKWDWWRHLMLLHSMYK